MISKNHYHDQAIFDREIAELFSRGWQFVGLLSELSNNRDFVCLDHPGAAVVVQNFKGELRGFQNICTHRFNRIQTAERGNRPLMCGYHGWMFDRTGFPSGMPKKDQFLGGDDAELCLTPYPVGVCGQFVFVDLGGGGALRDHLGVFHDVLEDMSRHIGPEMFYGGMRHAANWKLLVENVLECLHCSVVHQETFIKLGVGRLPIDDVVSDRGHSSSHFPRIDERREDLRQRYLAHLKGRGMTHNSLLHLHIFPNLFISSPEGLSFYVGQAVPLAPGDTMLKMRLLEPAVDLTEKQRLRQAQLNEGTIATTEAVIDEDRHILEGIQRGLRLADKPGRIGAEEVRIRVFHEHYLAVMAAGSAAPHRLEMAAE